jgi:uncharacterized protein
LASLSVSRILFPFPCARQSYYDFLHRLIDAGFEDRIMFGSDEMVWPDAVSSAIENCFLGKVIPIST